MPHSRVALADNLSDTLASLQPARSGLSDAWALRMSAFHKAHFAAVVGNSLTRNCREQGWIVEEASSAERGLAMATRAYTRAVARKGETKPTRRPYDLIFMKHSGCESAHRTFIRGGGDA